MGVRTMSDLSHRAKRGPDSCDDTNELASQVIETALAHRSCWRSLIHNSSRCRLGLLCIRYEGQPGKNMLALSSSQFDP